MSTRPQYDADHPPVYQAAPAITSLDYSSDGRFLAVSGYHEVVLHHADGSGIAARLVGQSERIEAAVFSPDGKRIAIAGGSPGRMGELQIWDVDKRELLLAKTVGYDTIYGAQWSGDGRLVSFGCPDNTVRAVLAETGEQVFFNGAHNDWALDTVFSVKSDHLISVSRDRSMKLFEVTTQRFVDNLTSITPGALKGGLHGVARHPTRDELLCGGSDGTPKIYRMQREQARQIGDDFNLIRAFPEMPGRVFDVRYSPDGTRIVAGSSLNGSGQVRIFDEANEKNEIAKIDVSQGGIYSVAFSHDGKMIAAGGFDGMIRLYDAETGTLVKEFAPVEIQPEADTVSGGGK
jgi:WD40 repeat protein